MQSGDSSCRIAIRGEICHRGPQRFSATQTITISSNVAIPGRHIRSESSGTGTDAVERNEDHRRTCAMGTPRMHGRKLPSIITVDDIPMLINMPDDIIVPVFGDFPNVEDISFI